MKTILIFILIVLSSLNLLSQSAIKGHIVDAENNPIPFANIIIKSGVDSTFITGTTSNNLGDFQIEISKNYNLYLEISSIGYETKIEEIHKEKSDYPILLINSSHLLSQVTIEARKALYELKSDRVVVNVGSIPSFGGDDALQVLKKSPGVLVDENGGSISMNNKGEVLIMINNRISRIPMDVLINQLRGIRAENIEKIELIHQPSVKYDSDSNAGIIHIVLKSNDIAGFYGNVSLSAGYGQREKANGSIGLNYRRGKLNLYGDVSSYSARSNKFQINHGRTYEYLGAQYSFSNDIVVRNFVAQGIFSNIGLDYNLNNSTIIGVLASVNQSHSNFLDLDSESNFFVNDALIESTANNINNKSPVHSQFVNINLFKSLAKDNSLSLDVDRVVFNADNLGSLLAINSRNELDSERNTEIKIWTFKGDYQQSFENGIQLESGVKATINNTESRSSAMESQNNEWSVLENFAREDFINEEILAAYTSIKKKFNETWNGEFGLRFENYNYTINTKTGNEDQEIKLNNLFPILRLNYTIDSIRSLNVSFNRRTSRPTFNNLVAYQVFLDPTLYVASNVKLRPAFTNSVRLSFGYKSVLASLEASRTNNTISYYNTVEKESGVQISTPINFDKMESIVANYSMPIYLKSWLESNFTLSSGYYRVFDSTNRPLPFDKGIFSHSIQINNTVNLHRGITVNLGGRYNSPFISGDQFQSVGVSLDFGISKKLSNGSLVFNIQDITNTRGIIYWEYEQAELGVRTFGDNNFSERVFRFTYSTSFGDNKLKAKRNRQTGSQEDRNRM